MVTTVFGPTINAVPPGAVILSFLDTTGTTDWYLLFMTSLKSISVLVSVIVVLELLSLLLLFWFVVFCCVELFWLDVSVCLLL